MAPRRFLAAASLLTIGGLTLGLTAPAAAATPDNHYHSVTTAGSVALFSGYTSARGNELYSTDGTKAGTKLVKDLVPGKVSGLDLNQGVPYFTTIGTKTYFSAHGASTNLHLWVTDGTAAGTTQLTGAGKFKYGSSPFGLTAVGDELFFSVRSSTAKYGRVLWKSDGTKAGTKAVAGVLGKKGKYGYVGSYPQFLTAVGSKLYFAVLSSKDTSKLDIWSTDGTTSKRELSYPQTNVGTGYLQSLSEFDDKLVIVTTSRMGKEQRIWSYDGSGVPTPLTTVTTVSKIPVEFDGSLFFLSSYSAGIREPQLMRVTPTGAANGVKPTILNDDDVDSIVIHGDKLWFETHDSPSESIWTLDSATTTPVLVKATGVQYHSLDRFDNTAYLDGNVYFVLRGQLWKSDGTTAGTVRVLSFNMPVGYALNTHIAVAGDHIAVTLSDKNGKSALWLSDGTAEGTTKVLPAG